MKPTKPQLIAHYSRFLVRYEAEGDPMAVIQRALIERLKADVAREVKA